MNAIPRAIALWLIVFLVVGQAVRASAPRQERLPGSDGYCPLIARPGDRVTLRLSVANRSPASAQGTLTVISVPGGLILDEGSVWVVPGAGAGRFLERAAASAAAGMVWASTDAADDWQFYTLVVAARIASSAVGEQRAIAQSWDSAGNLIRRVDGIVYAQSDGARREPAALVVDMGVPATCKPEPAPSSTPTATPTSTPVPAPYFAKRVMLTDVEGARFSLSVVCVVDPGQSANRPPVAEYQVAFELPAGARVAMGFGSNPNIAGDGRTARFSVRPGGPTVRVAIASRPAAGEPAWQMPIVPGIRVSAEAFGELSERSADAGAACDPDPALLPALASAERAGQAARARAGAVEPKPEALSTPDAPQGASTATPNPTRSATVATGPIAPTQAPALASGEPSAGGTLPDPRSIMLPLVCGVGVALAALAFTFIARRRGGDE